MFCLLAHSDKATLDPLDLGQWEFYVLPSQVLDKRLTNQKTVSLAGLLRLGPTKSEFWMINKVIKLLMTTESLLTQHKVHSILILES